MMKIIRTSYVLAVCALIAVVLDFSACKKDNNLKTNIVGIWNHDARLTGYLQRDTYRFNADSTMQFTGSYLDTTGTTLLGYNYYMTGKFSFDGTTMKLYQLTTYEDLDTTPLAYTTLQALQPVQTVTTQSFGITFNTNYSAFTIIARPCGPNTNCIISSQLYMRQ